MLQPDFMHCKIYLLQIKIGFWTIRVNAEGQIAEEKIKVEKYYIPKGYELLVMAPSFILDTENVIEATVEGSFITERLGKGTTYIKWYAKKVDYQNPLYNDTVLYRKVSQNE